MLSQQTPPTDANQGREKIALPAESVVAPNLIVIGAMKASTTTFYELITRHPNVWFASEKEPHYFTSPQYDDPTAWENYLQLFEAAPKTATYIGEASTGYSKLPHFGNTPQRLQRDLRQPRFIYLVRDPVERVVSNYQHSYLSGHYSGLSGRYSEGTTLGQAIEQDPILIDGSCYARQIRAYREVFGREQLLIITTDQLHAEPQQVMQRVESFLELPAYDGWDSPLPQSNSKQALGRSLALQSILPKPVLDALRRLLPASIRNRLKSMAATTPTLPPISAADRKLVFENIADDLRDLLSLADADLSAWITNWPSAKQLGER